MATFVIVHGAFGGGWEWTEVAAELRRRGHQTFTPTLTGLGERWQLGPGVGLATHVQDVVAVLECEDLHDVALCGASYGGMAVTGAADRCAERVALVIYIDALISRHGQSGLDLLPDVRCTAGQIDVGGDLIAPMAARAKAESWLYQELATPHDPHLFDPAGTAAVLEGLASSARAQSLVE